MHRLGQTHRARAASPATAACAVLMVIMAMIVRMRMVIMRVLAVIVLVMIMGITVTVLMAARPAVCVLMTVFVRTLLMRMLIVSMLAVDMAAMRAIAVLVAMACAGMRLVRSITPASVVMLCRPAVVMVMLTLVLVLVFALPLRVRANSVRSMLVLFRLSLVMCAARCSLRLITVPVVRLNRRMRMHVGMGLRRMPRASTAMRWLVLVGRGRWVVCGRVAHVFSFAKRMGNQ
ncbi:MAG: hypothetical protein Q4A11_07310 [Brachymonas sp.]|nr:hypothetical protein [Brachymonas sp.]